MNDRLRRSPTAPTDLRHGWPAILSGRWSAAVLIGVLLLVPVAAAQDLQPLKYNNPGLVVDLGVGLWATPLPMDYDGDGKMDLVVVSAGKPSNGIFFFKNAGALPSPAGLSSAGNDAQAKSRAGGDARAPRMPLFKPGVRIADGLQNLQISYVNGKPRILRTGDEYADFPHKALAGKVKLPVAKENLPAAGRIRANQWRYADYDGDGVQDLVIGLEDWADYGWDDAFSAKGEWTRGPLRGWVYLLHNAGTDEQPKYLPATKVEAAGKPIDAFGMPSPCFADFRRTGKLDLICGDFRGQLTWFENTGTRTQPRYAAARPVRTATGPIDVDSPMINVVAVDFDGDGHVDLIVGREDGRVQFIANTGKVEDGQPVFEPRQFFQQEAAELKFGVLATPVAVDWDGDGRQDLLCGNAAGKIGFFKNLGGDPQKWAAPVELQAGGKTICITAGPNGSIQGPAEAKWGYTTISVADWDGDGLPDLLVNSIWGKVLWYRNIGTRTEPKLAAAEPITADWPNKAPKPPWVWWEPNGNELVTQWRTTPLAMDVTGDGLADLVMLDRDGFLSLFERRRVDGKLHLLPPRHAFRMEAGETSAFDASHKPAAAPGVNTDEAGLSALDAKGQLAFITDQPATRVGLLAKRVDRANDPAYLPPVVRSAEATSKSSALRLNAGWAGKSGRRKLTLVDWDGDGKLDLLVNSTNVNFLRNVSADPKQFVFKDMGPMARTILAGHDTSPGICDFNGDGVPDLIVGAEDGLIYWLKNPRSK